MSEERTITVHSRAFDKFTWAKKKNESYSDVIVGLVSTKNKHD